MNNIKYCYIHIPFCNKICSYCDFSKLLYDKNMVNKYLDGLDKEISNKYNNDLLETIYIGGGTPSCLDINELKVLFKIINKLNKSNLKEFTFECNYESLTYEKLLFLYNNNVNRLSIGLESINDNNLELLGRKLDKDKFKDVISMAKEIGFKNINVDLMYALCNESLDVLEEDIKYILDLDITHVSTYSLIIEKNTKLYINNYKNIDEDTDYKMYKKICSILKDNSFIHYEISNFAKEGYEAIHNLSYWNNNNYYGFGLGASYYIDNIRGTNTKSFTKYISCDYDYYKEELDNKKIIEYEVILNLRKSNGIDLDNFKEKYHNDLSNYYNYLELVDSNLLKLNNNHLYIDEDNLYISNYIIVKLLENEV